MRSDFLPSKFSVFAVFLALRTVSSGVSPSILYPTGLPQVNYVDSVVVTYQSSWPRGTNLSCNCQQDANASNLVWDWADNPVGGWSYVFPSLGTILSKFLFQYPTNCWFNLYPDVPSDGKVVVGGNFTMIYATRSATTWAELAAPTSGLPPPSTTSVTTATGSSGSFSAASAPSSSLSHSPPLASSGLSTGAKIGAGVGAGLGGLVLLGALAYILRLRRNNARLEKRIAYIPQVKEGNSGQDGIYEKHQSSGPIYEKSGEPSQRGGAAQSAT